MKAADIKPFLGRRVLGRIGRWPFIGFVNEYIPWELSSSGRWVRVARCEGVRGVWLPIACFRVVERIEN